MYIHMYIHIYLFKYYIYTYTSLSLSLYIYIGFSHWTETYIDPCTHRVLNIQEATGGEAKSWRTTIRRGVGQVCNIEIGQVTLKIGHFLWVNHGKPRNRVKFKFNLVNDHDSRHFTPALIFCHIFFWDDSDSKRWGLSRTPSRMHGIYQAWGLHWSQDSGGVAVGVGCWIAGWWALNKGHVDEE